MFTDYREEGQRINNEYYVALLVRLNDELIKINGPYPTNILRDVS